LHSVKGKLLPLKNYFLNIDLRPATITQRCTKGLNQGGGAGTSRVLGVGGRDLPKEPERRGGGRFLKKPPLLLTGKKFSFHLEKRGGGGQTVPLKRENSKKQRRKGNNIFVHFSIIEEKYCGKKDAYSLLDRLGKVQRKRNCGGAREC